MDHAVNMYEPREILAPKRILPTVKSKVISALFGTIAVCYTPVILVHWAFSSVEAALHCLLHKRPCRVNVFRQDAIKQGQPEVKRSHTHTHCIAGLNLTAE